MTTRRKFLKKTIAGSAAFFIVPRHVLGRGFIPPSDKLGVAAIGIGGRGAGNLTNSFASNNASIVALCDVDDRRAKTIREQFPEAPYMRDYRDMLEKHNKDIDAVIVSSASSVEKFVLTFWNAVRRSSPSPSFTILPMFINCTAICHS